MRYTQIFGRIRMGDRGGATALEYGLIALVIIATFAVLLTLHNNKQGGPVVLVPVTQGK